MAPLLKTRRFRSALKSVLTIHDEIKYMRLQHSNTAEQYKSNHVDSGYWKLKPEVPVLH